MSNPTCPYCERWLRCIDREIMLYECGKCLTVFQFHKFQLEKIQPKPQTKLVIR